MANKVPWHLISDDDEMARVLAKTVQQLWDEQHSLRDKWLRHFSFYYGRMIDSWEQLAIPDRTHDVWENASDESEITAWNLTRSVIDTFVSRLGVNEPEPRILTEGSKVDQQEQALLREQFMRGALQQAKSHDKATTALWSAAICGVGHVKTYSRDQRVRQRFLRPDTVLVDPFNTLDDGSSRCEYQHESIDRYQLLAHATNPAQIAAIEQAPAVMDDTITDGQYRDRVLTIEAWCKPLGKDPGLRALIVPGAGVNSAVLEVDRDWEDDCSPISTLTFGRFVAGHHSDGLAAIVEGCARMINRLLWKAMQNHEHLAVPHITGPMELEDQLKDNRAFRFLPSNDGPVVVVAPNAIPPETITLLELHWSRGYEVSGMNQQSARGTVPAGLNASGAAIIEHNENQSLRWSDPEEKFEEFQAINLGDQVIRAGRRIAESEEGWSVELEDDAVVKKIDWPDLGLEEANFRVSHWPASQLGSTPAGRQAKIQGLAQTQALDREEIRSLLRLKDLDRHLELTTSPRTMYRKILEDVASGKAFVEPTEYDRADLDVGMFEARLIRAREIAEGRDADAIEDWMALAAAILAPPEHPPEHLGPELAAEPLGQGLPADPAAALQLAQAQQVIQGSGNGEGGPVQ